MSQQLRSSPFSKDTPLLLTCPELEILQQINDFPLTAYLHIKETPELLQTTLPPLT
ncbi:MAG: hypothetical protein WCA35_03350 [Kovacikia sp.]